MASIGKSLARRFCTFSDGPTFAPEIEKQKIMSQPMIVWCVIAGVLLFAFVFRAVEQYYTECRHSGRKPRRMIEIGKESEMFYIPGDIKDDDLEDF